MHARFCQLIVQAQAGTIHQSLQRVGAIGSAIDFNKVISKLIFPAPTWQQHVLHSLLLDWGGFLSNLCVPSKGALGKFLVTFWHLPQEVESGISVWTMKLIEPDRAIYINCGGSQKLVQTTSFPIQEFPELRLSSATSQSII